MSLSRYYHTLRYLKPRQFYRRLWHRLYQPQPDMSSPPALREKKDSWIIPCKRKPSIYGIDKFNFLNQKHVISNSESWYNKNIDKLWLYNLHYFDDLNASDSASRKIWHRELLDRWVEENPPVSDTGWEPYPTSLRIVNWIKWALTGNELGSECIQSLAIQTRWLAKRLEYHLLGNHLFANAKALLFAGLFFDGEEADNWFSKGLAILGLQISEQILKDGGQFERSTMYHALALEDMLDIINLAGTYTGSRSDELNDLMERNTDSVNNMRHWLDLMCHPDGEISLFNDSAMCIAPSPAELERYAHELGFEPILENNNEIVHLEDSGYVRIKLGAVSALLDVAPIGPDYLPGHAHADTLSFEMSIYSKRVLVNSGTSCYGVSEERLRQRGTSAHNTVVINGQNSSEVWSGFRVARRAKPFGLAICREAESVSVKCSHDGYHRLSGKPTHTRKWEVTQDKITIMDQLDGKWETASAYFYFHPDIKIERIDAGECIHIYCQNKQITFEAINANIRIMDSSYHPEFGVSIPNQCICLEFLESHVVTTLNWE